MKLNPSGQNSPGLNLKKFVCLLTLIVFHSLLFAQNAQIEREIKSLDEEGSVLMLKEDTNAISKIYDPGIIVNAPFNSVTTGREVIFHLVHTGFIKLSGFTIVVEKVLVEGVVAISMGSETVTFEKNSTNPHAGQTIRRRYTHVYLKKSDGWKLIARHANEICAS